MMAIYRQSQENILTYQSGRMGIAAVPGSGKTWTLSQLAGKLVLEGGLDDDQEVLVVTLVNSAVDHFYRQVSEVVESFGLLPHMGYRVRTLHGLAHDIVRERPSLVQLDDNFSIIDEAESAAIRSEISRTWIRTHPNEVIAMIDPNLAESKRRSVIQRDFTNLINEIALAMIRSAKDQRLAPERLRQRLDDLPIKLPLAEMGWEIYDSYQRALDYRGAVDFDDLIRLALQALETDADYLSRLRHHWPYILEDEAQDSSRLQEQILEMLAGFDGNWVRVGDPNQAIYETFTTASPQYLRAFVSKAGVRRMELPESGRSTPSLIKLANYLVEWTIAEHPILEARSGLSAPPLITPTAPNDPQPNPLDDPGAIRLLKESQSADKEIQNVARSLSRWLSSHPDWTVAVLSTRSSHAGKLTNFLEQMGIPYIDSLLNSSHQTRTTARILEDVIRHLAEPDKSTTLANAYLAWRWLEVNDIKVKDEIQSQARLLRRMPRVEDFIWPSPDSDWFAKLDSKDINSGTLEDLFSFRSQLQRWQEAAQLPIDQLVLLLAQDLFTTPADLALAHKLAVILDQASQAHPDWRFKEFINELHSIAENVRRLAGFSDEDSGFNPDDLQYKGKVVLSTIHKAKGLEWDRVYLMSVNDYDFPSGLPGETYYAEKWFLLDRLNLQAEAIAQLQTALSGDEYTWYTSGEATSDARLDYVRERLRLLYVGITRARRELVITWNTGRNNDCHPAHALLALEDFWNNQKPVD